MLTEMQAMEIVSGKLKDMNTGGDPLIVIEKFTIRKAYGWVFFYNTIKFLETGENRLAGNGPVIVNKYDGSVSFFGAAKPVHEVIEEYEKKLRVSRRI
jgi:hypothetical protein